MSEKKDLRYPEISEIEEAIQQERYKRRYLRTLRSTLYSLIVVAAIAVLVATLWLPVMRIFGTSMTPTISEGEIVIALKGSTFENGDIIGFYYGNRLLVKRVIATSGQWVELDWDGNVKINGQPLDEPYLKKKAYGDVNIEFPYQVPEGRVFVMGDNRETSYDSRNSAIGCVSNEQIVGRVVLRIWPIWKIGTFK